MTLLFSIIIFCVVLVAAVLLFAFGLAAGILGLVGSLVISVLGFGLKLTFKTVCVIVAVLMLLFWLL